MIFILLELDSSFVQIHFYAFLDVVPCVNIHQLYYLLLDSFFRHTFFFLVSSCQQPLFHKMISLGDWVNYMNIQLIVWTLLFESLYYKKYIFI